MTQNEANLQSLSLCTAFLLAFIGLVHEVIGPTLFPLLPAWMGPILWHAIGIFLIVAGLLSIGGILGAIKFPVIACGVLVGFAGSAATVLVAYLYQQFHFFGVCGAIAGFTLAVAHTKALRLRAA
jgi:hypothetical protein